MTDASDPRPKKRYGQHFLSDRSIIGRIVEAAGVLPGDAVLEIGPGRGDLTAALIKAGARVTAIEVDKNLAALLYEKFRGNENFELIEKDALKISFVEMSRGIGGRFKAVSNLPYNISGPMLVKFLDEREAFTRLTLMFQKEVAERITAVPGTKAYGALTVLVNAYAETWREFDVRPGAFYPPPKVTSTVVGIRFLKNPLVPEAMDRAFRKVVKAAFGLRRKTLLNALKTTGADAKCIAAALEDARIDPKRRGETLTIDEFIGLTRAFIEKGFSV